MAEKIKLIEMRQPIGVVYLGTLSIETVGKIIAPGDEKILYDGGNEPSQTEIMPSAVVLSVRSEDMPTVSKDGNTYEVSFDDESRFAEVIAGNISPLHEKGREYSVSVIFVFDITNEEKWYIQETLGVNCGHEYDKVRDTPEMKCHIIARCLNDGDGSPLFGMLPITGGKKESGKISQGMFVRLLLPMLTEDSRRGISRAMEFESGDSENTAVVLRILKNYFSAIRDIYTEKWDCISEKDMEKWMSMLPTVFWKCFDKRDMTKRAMIKVLKEECWIN